MLLEAPLSEYLIAELVEIDALDKVLSCHEENRRTIRLAGHCRPSLVLAIRYLFNAKHLPLPNDAQANLLKLGCVFTGYLLDRAEGLLELL